MEEWLWLSLLSQPFQQPIPGSVSPQERATSYVHRLRSVNQLTGCCDFVLTGSICNTYCSLLARSLVATVELCAEYFYIVLLASSTCKKFPVMSLMNCSSNSSPFDVSINPGRGWLFLFEALLLFLPDEGKSWSIGVASHPTRSCRLGLKHTTRRLNPGNRSLHYIESVQ